MKKNYFILLLSMLYCATTFAQETQKNFINYQGVARNADGELMVSEAMTLNIALKFGAANSSASYEESHSLTTDTNGVFSLLIGNGTATNGSYNALPWGSAATFVTVYLNGTEMGTTEMMAVPYAISSGDADDQSAAEVFYDNSDSGLSAMTAQDAIDELAIGGSIDADSDPENEFQMLNFDAGTNELSLSNGNSVTIPSGGTDADADPENELQTLNFNTTTNELSLSDGNTIVIPTGGTDGDADPENEIDVTRRHGLLVGDDGLVDGLVGTADGQVAKWDASLGNWVAGTDNTGAGGSSLWADNGGDIYFNSGKVGVGVTNPSGKLQVSQDSDIAPFMVLETTSGSTADIRFRKAGVNESWDQVATIEADEASSILNYTFYDGGTAHNIMTLRGNRRMGINNFNPQTELDVAGQIRSSDLSGGGNVIADADGNLIIGAGGGGGSLWTENRGDVSYSVGNVGIGIAVPRFLLDVKGRGETTLNLETSDNNNFIRFVNSDGYQGYAGILNGNRDMDFGTGSDNEVGKVHLTINSSPKLTVANDGNVGIGTMEPSTKLDVDGNIRSSDLSGTGQRNVMADADGRLIIGSSVGGGSATGFESLDEGSGLGWRLIGRNNNNYGPIGLNALDASTNGTASTTRGATGLSSTAMGEETTASGPRSTAIGYGSEASGSVSIALGEETEASGEFAVAMGDRTLASEQSSTAFGSGTRATGTHATAMGESTEASGKSSASMGVSTRAESLASVAVGRNNIGRGDPFEWRPTDPLFEIGNGSEAIPNNALTVLKNGRVGIGTSDPKAIQQLHSSSARSDIQFTTDLTGDGAGDGLQIGMVNDLGLGTAGYVMNEENGPLQLGTNSATRMFIASGGFIGINTFHPGYRLDVDGDIRSTELAGSGQRNVMADADGKLVVGSGGGGSSLWSEDANGIAFSTGNIGVGGASSATFPLNITTDSERPINLTSSDNDNYIAFNNASGYKGYAGIFNGDADMDFGTGFLNGTGKVHLVTNTVPRLTVAANGDVGIGTINPTSKLEVAGDIKTTSEIHGPDTGNANMIPIAYGRIADDGTIEEGSGNFTINKLPSYYFIRIDGATNSDATHFTMVASILDSGSGPGFITTGYGLSGGLGSMIVRTYDISGASSDRTFSFVIYKD